MNWKKKQLRNYRLHVVLNKPFFKDTLELISAARKICVAGGQIIQLRDKESDKRTILETAVILKKRLKLFKSFFIVNDHVDIALLSNADGVHLGQTDLPLCAARKILGRDKIIGVSCLNLQQALLAQEEGADYLGVGPVFVTDTKADCQPTGLGLLRRVSKKIKIPIFAIGGINEMNISEVLSVGPIGVAISSAICCSLDLTLATRRFLNILN